MQKFKLHPIKKIETFNDRDRKVYDLTVEDNHSYIAENFVVHNSICTTRIETGNGVPQLHALSEVQIAIKKYYELSGKKVYTIADGGIRSPGDCVKALCFADLVMTGNMFAGTDETGGDDPYSTHREYSGSSTYKNSRKEGVKAFVDYKGSADKVLTRILEGIQSGCSYQGVDNLEDLKCSPEWVQITSAGVVESHPHDVIMK